MRDTIIGLYANSLERARTLTADVPCDRCAELPFDGAKHPGWVLSHLVVAAGMGAAVLSGDPVQAGTLSDVPDAMAAAGMPGTSAEPDRPTYATKDELLAELERTHALFAERFRAAPDELLAAEFPIPDYRSFFPTIEVASVYLLVHHEPYHLGQLQAWRRAAGFATV